MPLNIPTTQRKRVVIAGGGFGGLKIAQKLKNSDFQIVLIDRNNYHQFQPLFYQVAMSGLEPSSIAFPLRKLFQRKKNVHIRTGEVISFDSKTKKLVTDAGEIWYDYLILAMGCRTNYFGMDSMEQKCLSLKSISESLYLRNQVLEDYERALKTDQKIDRQKYLDIAIVGGGPTGVELAGALAEMRRYIIPKEYDEFDYREVDIYLIHANGQLLPAMSKKAGEKALKYLRNLDVKVEMQSRVVDFDGHEIKLHDDRRIAVGKVIWAAGVTPNVIGGLPEGCLGPGRRILVDEFNRVQGLEDVFAIGDQCIMTEKKWPEGHPQVAQTALQQGQRLARNLRRMATGKSMRPFRYRDKGSLATIGRNKAVADLPGIHFGGFIAWWVWLFVHLFALIGTKNRIFVFLNWFWNYITYDQSLRLIIRPIHKNERNHRSDPT